MHECMGGVRELFGGVSSFLLWGPRRLYSRLPCTHWVILPNAVHAYLSYENFFSFLTELAFSNICQVIPDLEDYANKEAKSPVGRDAAGVIGWY